MCAARLQKQWIDPSHVLFSALVQQLDMDGLLNAMQSAQATLSAENEQLVLLNPRDANAMADCKIASKNKEIVHEVFSSLVSERMQYLIDTEAVKQ